MTRLAIFASGKGSNARKIIEHFKGSSEVEVALLVTNNKNSMSKDIAQEFGISFLHFQNELVENGLEMLKKLHDYKIDFVVLAGFLRKIPSTIIEAYPKHIINIHPALLPKFGGKGMYGMHVHQAVIDAGEQETGITIHLVNEKYDEGQVIAQHKIQVPKGIKADDLAQLIHHLEHAHFPVEIEKYILHA